MDDRIKDATVTVVFVIILIFVFVINIIVKDKEISNSERRKLALFPKINKENITDGNLSEDFEKYFSDQFVGRDRFRSLKSFISLNIFRQKDNNALFVKDNSIYKMEYKLHEKNLQKSASKIEDVYMGNEKVEEVMKKYLKDLKYIEISDCLDLSDYYRTDLHWKQENLSKVVNRLQTELQLENFNLQEYEQKDWGDFYGAYYGQLGMNIEPDKIYALTNEEIENCITYNFESQKKGRVYQEKGTSKSNKELILFRDSFGSSLAPLLINNYKTITLVDIRYISSKILEQYIDFTNQDVLFLYSTLILNQNVLK